MSPQPRIPAALERLLAEHQITDPSVIIGLYSLICAAGDDGTSKFNDVAIHYRTDHLKRLREEGRDVEREAGRLSLDEVRDHLAKEVIPRLAEAMMVVLPEVGLSSPDTRVRISAAYGPRLREVRPQIERAGGAGVVRRAEEITGPHRVEPDTGPRGSTLAAQALVKTYRRRRVVNDVALSLRQGEIVGLLGPNGAGKTTTFYMIVGLIPPDSGRILLDGDDITEMPMYKRARQGIGYLSQERRSSAS